MDSAGGRFQPPEGPPGGDPAERRDHPPPNSAQGTRSGAGLQLRADPHPELTLVILLLTTHLQGR